MKIQVSEATNLQLDWLVATCLKLNVYIPAFADKPWLQITDLFGKVMPCPKWSTDWAVGGPLIPSLIQAGYTISSTDFDSGFKVFKVDLNDVYYSRGPTLLIAAMRCYVAKELGQEVDIPPDLT